MSFICLKRDIQENEWRTFSLFNQEIIVKNEKGAYIVASNACKHRHFKVANGCGKGPIRCQYHGQRFGFERKLNHYEMGEFIFSPNFLQSSSILTKLSESIGDEFGEHKMQVKAPFHLWVQNTADPNHLGTIHKTSFSKLFDSTRPENVYLSEFESSYTLRIKDDIIEKYSRLFKMPSDEKLNWFHYIGFPNLSVTSFLGVFYSIETANPIDKNTCEVHSRFFLAKDTKMPKILTSMALENNRKILLEDKELVEAWAKGYKYDGTEAWMQGEERIKRYADEIKSRGLA